MFFDKSQYYLRSPMSDRTAEELAQMYHYENLSTFADDLPERAAVLDVGAGLSSLGHEVCRLRPDIKWVNADIQYDNPSIQPDWLQEAPDNLQFVAANSHRLETAFGADCFDRVYSSFMLPHLHLAGRQCVREALQSMYTVTKPNGYLLVRPWTRHGYNGKRVSSALQINRSPDITEPTLSNQVINGFAFSPVFRAAFKLRARLYNYLPPHND